MDTARRAGLARVVAAVAALVIFGAFAAHGLWVTGLVYAAVPVIYLLSLTGKALAGVPLSSWALLAGVWAIALTALYLATRESVGDQPDHWELATALGVGSLVMGAVGVLLAVGTRRMMRSTRS